MGFISKYLHKKAGKTYIEDAGKGREIKHLPDGSQIVVFKGGDTLRYTPTGKYSKRK